MAVNREVNGVDAASQLRAYEFGPYRLEPADAPPAANGEPVPLTPKAFDTLLALIERRDRVVDKAELMRLVWPDSFVEEANLSQTIFVLRKTLGEAADGTAVHRHGAAPRLSLRAPTCGKSAKRRPAMRRRVRHVGAAWRAAWIAAAVLAVVAVCVVRRVADALDGAALRAHRIAGRPPVRQSLGRRRDRTLWPTA